MSFTSPGQKTLILCWLVLIALTMGTMMTGRVTSAESISSLLIIALGVITWFKSLLILRYYLNLKSASAGWNKAFSSYLFIVLGLVTVIFLIGRL